MISCSGREAAEWGGVDWRGEWSDQRDWGLREAADHLRESLLLLICNPSQPGHFGGCQLHSAPLWTRLLYCCWSTWLCALGRVRTNYIAAVWKTAFHGKFGVNRHNVRRETVYETPHSLLDNISLGYRQVFLAHPFFISFVTTFSTFNLWSICSHISFWISLWAGSHCF